MNIIEFLFYYFIFVFTTVTLLKSSVKKESYENIMDYKIDTILHQIRKELSQKIGDGFTNETKIVTAKPTIKANYVNAYEDISPYIEEFFRFSK